jgi:hypothetical protein
MAGPIADTLLLAQVVERSASSSTAAGITSTNMRPFDERVTHVD